MSHNDCLLIQSIPIGPMLNLAYFFGDKDTGEIAVVDPGWDIPFILDTAKKKDLKITCILLSHGHYDHADGAKELTEALNIPVYISEKEIALYLPDCPHLKKTKHCQKIFVGKVAIECLHTPGHTPGCQCFYTPGHLLAGDTLFVGGCGRCDLPGGSEEELLRSMEKVINKLPDDTIIYPGHAYGPLTSTIGKERKKNPYLGPHHAR